MTPEKPCSCTRNPFADLPPELRPRSQKKSLLRQVTCPSCGREYFTNRSTDICFGCERKGLSAR